MLLGWWAGYKNGTEFPVARLCSTTHLLGLSSTHLDAHLPQDPVIPPAALLSQGTWPHPVTVFVLFAQHCRTQSHSMGSL